MAPGQVKRGAAPAEAELERLVPLADPVRRALYLHVCAAAEEVTRDAAAEAVGVSRSLAAFHLDRLEKAGLLSSIRRRLTGRTGPGAGRPAKLYRRAPGQVDLTLPARRYEAASRIFLEALGRFVADGPEHVARAARGFGEGIGAEARRRAGEPASGERIREAVVEVLDDFGFEPVESGRTVRLRNCPFHALVDENRELVCGMNLALLRGASDAAGAPLEPEQDPQPGHCCVALHEVGEAQPGGRGRAAAG